MNTLPAEKTKANPTAEKKPSRSYARVFYWLAEQPNTLVSIGAKLIYSILADYTNSTGEAWPKLATIAARCGLGRIQIWRYIRELKRLKLIAVSRTGKRCSNRYQLLEHPWQKGDVSHLQHHPESDVSHKQHHARHGDVSHKVHPIESYPVSDKQTETETEGTAAAKFLKEVVRNPDGTGLYPGQIDKFSSLPLAFLKRQWIKSEVIGEKRVGWFCNRAKEFDLLTWRKESAERQARFDRDSRERAERTADYEKRQQDTAEMLGLARRYILHPDHAATLKDFLRSSEPVRGWKLGMPLNGNVATLDECNGWRTTEHLYFVVRFLNGLDKATRDESFTPGDTPQWQQDAADLTPPKLTANLPYPETAAGKVPAEHITG